MLNNRRRWLHRPSHDAASGEVIFLFDRGPLTHAVENEGMVLLDELNVSSAQSRHITELSPHSLTPAHLTHSLQRTSLTHSSALTASFSTV